MPEISELEAQTYCENRMGEQDVSGRDLRLIWEEHLDEAARRRIRRAIWRGHALADLDEAAVAVARVRGMRRAVKWTALLNVVIGAFFVALLLSVVELPAPSTFWWLVLMMSLVAVVSPPLGWLRRRQLDRAIRANTNP